MQLGILATAICLTITFALTLCYLLGMHVGRQRGYIDGYRRSRELAQRMVDEHTKNGNWV